jgi:hypothetical protein
MEKNLMDVICPCCGRQCKATGNRRGYRMITHFSRHPPKKPAARYVYRTCDDCDDRKVGRS